MVDAVRIRLCSAVTVEAAGRTLTGQDLGSRKARTLLALLAVERGRLVPLDRVVDALWPEAPPADPAANVATLVSRTRRLLGADVLSTQGRAYGLLGGACTVDLDEAAALVDEARDRLAAEEPALAAAAALRALDLLGSQPALVDEPDAEWVRGARREADELRRHVRHLLAMAMTPTDPDRAVRVASDAVAADPYDERAVRDLMRGHVAGGSASAALAAYQALAGRLLDELGTDPAPPTAEMHLAVLRNEPPPPESAAVRARPGRPLLVGREDELGQVDRLWTDVGSRHGRLMLVVGEAGIGKTRLLDATADLAERTGGLVLGARCHPTERSLFLQPYVDALRPTLLGLPSNALAELLREHTYAWLSLLPELVSLVSSSPEPPATAALERRRAYDAVVAVLRRLSLRRPVLIAVDDLQNGAAATVDLLGYATGRLAGSRVLLAGAVRAEDDATVQRLADRATLVPLGALPASAVVALTSAAGLSAHGDAVLARTGGHALSVVECLRALASGDEGVPESLSSAVLARVDRLDPRARAVVQGASVLRDRLDPRMLADLAGTDELSAVHACEELTRTRLLQRVGGHYEFGNDLAQECVYASLAPALLVALHRRAADLLTDHPEPMAAHAFAAGEPGRAAQGWLLAGRAAMDRSAVEDAVGLFDRGVAVADTPGLRARLLLDRAVAHEARTTYDAGLADIDEALGLARETGDRRLEMAALRARGGDVPVGLHLPITDFAPHLAAGLELASGLGDRRAEADFTTRLVVIEASRLRLAGALARAETGLARARASASEEAVVLAQDGVKAALAYLGDADRLRDVVAELEPQLRRSRSMWHLQWTVFESAFVPASAGDWDTARARVAEAVEVNRRSGYHAYAGYFRAHLGWFERLAGDLDTALEVGAEAVSQTSPVDHPWWYATAAGLLAGTLVETGAADDAGAVARRGLVAIGPDAAEAGRLRCLAPLAAVTDDATGGDTVYEQACRLLEAVDCPPGQAWVIGADCYLLVARAALRRDDPGRAERALAPLREAVADRWTPIRDRVDGLLAQISSTRS